MDSDAGLELDAFTLEMKYIKYDNHMNSTEDIKCFLRQTYAVNIYTQHPENGVEACSPERPVSYAV